MSVESKLEKTTSLSQEMAVYITEASRVKESFNEAIDNIFIEEELPRIMQELTERKY